MGWVGALDGDTLARGKPVSIPERVWGGLEPVLGRSKDGVSSVSIPERVWGGLERLFECRIGFLCFVSIPERVWGGLERVKSRPSWKTASLFQSLRGFGVGWSLSLWMVWADLCQVSIPERVWGGLEPE